MTLGRIYAIIFVEGLFPRSVQCAKLGFCAIPSATLNEIMKYKVFTLQQLLGYRHQTFAVVQTKVCDNGGVG